MEIRVIARSAAIAAIAALGLAACGGGSNAANKVQTEAQREAAALPMSQTAKVPGNVHCGFAKPVWVNLHTKAYHEYGDPYYGKTKNGQYMCLSQAQQQGFHPAGARHKGMSNSANGSSGYNNGGNNSGGNNNGGNNNGNGNYSNGSNANSSYGGAAAGAAGAAGTSGSTRHHRRRHRRGREYNNSGNDTTQPQSTP